MTIVEITKTAKNPEFLRWIASNFISEKGIKEALISNPATPVDTLKGIFLHDYFLNLSKHFPIIKRLIQPMHYLKYLINAYNRLCIFMQSLFF